MKYLEFFSIEMEHAAYEDVPLPVVMDADKDTHAWIKKNGLVVKGKQNGVKVMAPSDLELEAKTGKQLTFFIFPNTATFGLCTDMGALSRQEMFNFSNSTKKRNGFYPLACTVTELAKDRYRGFKPVATLTLMVDQLKIKNAPIHYRASFPPIKGKWKYYFVVHSYEQKLSIEDRKGKVSFKRKNLRKNPSDELAPVLTQAYPEDLVFCFESKTDMLTSVKGRKDLQLKMQDQVLIQHLPNPDLNARGIRIMDLRGQ